MSGPPARGEAPPALDVRAAAGGVTLRVRVKPRASREAIEGARDGALVVRLTAPPVDGAANEALARLLGRALSLPPSAVTLERGATGRDKIVRIAGATPALVASLAAAAGQRRR